MMFHPWGPPFGSSMLGDPRTNTIFETYKQPVHFAANFFFPLNRDGALEIRGLARCRLDWLNAAGSDSVKKPRMLVIRNTVPPSEYLLGHVTWLSYSRSPSSSSSLLFLASSCDFIGYFSF